ncbi:MAG: ATP-binding protein [Thermodesulfobacteriota bacterium]|nr:ATP-binding protein [Thermodesulfobacteriota bacterium]
MTPVDITANSSEASPEKCPVSGLPVLSRPEWTDIQVDETYSVTFKFIGNQILFVLPKGDPGEWGMKRLFEARAEVLEQLIGPKDNYVEIRDFSGVNVSRSPKNARIQMVEGFRSDLARLLGFIGFNIPRTIQLGLQVGIKLYQPPVYINLTNSYKAAVSEALRLIQKNDAGIKRYIHSTMTKDDWSLQFSNGASSNFEVINDNILYGQCAGILTIDQAIQATAVMREIASYIISQQRKYYIISDLRCRERTSWAARKTFIQNITTLYDEYPFELLVFCDNSRRFWNLDNLRRPFFSFPTDTVRDMTEAMVLIQSHERQTINASWEGQQKTILYTKTAIEQYAEELRHYLGLINWEVEGIHHTRNTPPDHPFGNFFDAIDLIKGDLDELLFNRKLAEAQLRQSEEKYRTIIENIEDGYYETNLKGDICFFNKPLCRILGYTPDEIAGLNYTKYMSREVAGRIYKTFNKVFKTGKPVSKFVHEITRKDGTQRYVDVSISLIKDKEGEITGFRGIMRDVTRQQQTDEALRAAIQAAEDASQAKSDFLANISHELRTPMNGIMGMMGFLLESELDNEQRDFAEAAYEGAKRMMNIVNDLLDFSKLENKKLLLCANQVSISSVVSSAAADAAKDAAKKGVEFIFHYDPDIPDQLVGDPDRIKQILLNLLNNAIKFTSAGSVDLTCTCVDQTDTAATLCITVRDTGIGIPDGDIDRLFESFTQFDASLTRPYDGAGLGLPITRQLVEMMGGTIQVESRENKGTTFTCTMVLEKAAGTSENT